VSGLPRLIASALRQCRRLARRRHVVGRERGETRGEAMAYVGGQKRGRDGFFPVAEQLFHSPPQKHEQGDYATPEHAFSEQVEEPVRRRSRWGTRPLRWSHGCTMADRDAVLARARDNDVALAARRAQGEFRRTVLAWKAAGEDPSTSAPLGIAQTGAQHRVIRAVPAQAGSWALRIFFAGILQGSG